MAGLPPPDGEPGDFRRLTRLSSTGPAALRQDLGAVRFSPHISDRISGSRPPPRPPAGRQHEGSRHMVAFIFDILHQLVKIYEIVVLVHVILSLLLSFNVVNARNQLVGMIWQITSRLVEPVLALIRRALPFLRNLGNIDISPIILLVLLYAVDAHFLLPLAIQGHL
jgi:YggT family protein